MTDDELLNALDETFLVDSKAYLYFERRAAVRARMTARTHITAEVLWAAAGTGPAISGVMNMEDLRAALAALGSQGSMHDFNEQLIHETELRDALAVRGGNK
jgi:hypothetical protein